MKVDFKVERLGKDNVGVFVSRKKMQEWSREAIVEMVTRELLEMLVPIVVGLRKPIAIVPTRNHERINGSGTDFRFSVGTVPSVEIELILQEQEELPPGITGDEPMLG